MIISQQVEVSTDPAELTVFDETHTSNLRRTDDISHAVQAPSDAALWVGDESVSAATGFPIAAGQTISFDLKPGDRLYGVVATGTGTAYVLRTGV